MKTLHKFLWDRFKIIIDTMAFVNKRRWKNNEPASNSVILMNSGVNSEKIEGNKNGCSKSDKQNKETVESINRTKEQFSKNNMKIDKPLLVLGRKDIIGRRQKEGGKEKWIRSKKLQ